MRAPISPEPTPDTRSSGIKIAHRAKRKMNKFSSMAQASGKQLPKNKKKRPEGRFRLLNLAAD